MELVVEDYGADSRGEVAGNLGGRDVDNLQMNVSAQERRSQRDRAEQEENVLQEFENLLVAVKQTPRLWRVSRMGFLREFCSFVERNPDFSFQHGDNTTDMTLPVEDRELRLTGGYVKALAERRDSLTLAPHPILAVLSAGGTFRKESRPGNWAAQNVKLVTLTLVDGDGERIHTRLNNCLSHLNNELQRGDKIRLDLFTPIEYRVTNESPLLPALFVHQLSRVGRDNNLPDAFVNRSQFISCTTSKSNVVRSADWEPIDNELVIDPRQHDLPECTYGERKCAMYGVRFLNCVCDAIPVEKLDLGAIHQDCYFATTELKDMPNNQKRNMIYWWYATNIYNIAGRGNIDRLPLCLEYRVRQLYPNPDGEAYTGCKRGANGKRNRNMDS
jgi:hypothetical protein